MKSKHPLPLNLLLEAYRPLAFFLGEALIAGRPFLPAITRRWAAQLLRTANED